MRKYWGAVSSFISKHYVITAILLVIVFICLSFGSAIGFRVGPLHTTRNAITFDEVSHIGSGYFYDHEGSFYLNPEHPPLVKVIAGLPLQTSKVHPGKFEQEALTKVDDQWGYGRSLLFLENKKTDVLVAAARLAVTLFNATLLLAIFFVLHKLISWRAGLIALTFLVFNPAILGHASLVTFDVPVGLTMVLCLLTFVYYLKSPSFKTASLAGVTLALALLTKFSAVFLIPVIVLVMLVWLVLRRANLKSWGWSILHGLTIGAVAVILVTLFMLPLTMKISSTDMNKLLNVNLPGHLQGTQKVILTKMVNSGPATKAFASWLNGFIITQKAVEGGRPGTVFLGKQYGAEGAGPLYYPVLFVTKTPVITVVLATGMSVYIIYYYANRLGRYKKKKKLSTHSLFYLTFYIYCGSFLLFAAAQPINIGVRHFMPFIVGALILGAVAIDHKWLLKIYKKVQLRNVYLFGLVLIIIGTLTAFPYYISYYNLLAGGTENGYRIAVDSNYDWGQDLVRLREWMNENNIKNPYTDIFANPFGAEGHYLGPTQMVHSYKEIDKIPSGSYLIISASRLMSREARNNVNYSELYEGPVARVGTSIFIFQKK